MKMVLYDDAYREKTYKEVNNDETNFCTII